MSHESEPILCYVRGPWAYFTTQPIEKQWGDDWDDAPYEHNAGPPYEPRVYYFADGHREKCPEQNHPDGTPKFRIVKVAWEGDFEPPCEGHGNSPYSVQAINRGDVAWLRPSLYGSSSPEARPIPAGTTLAEFRRLVRLGGGRVYEAGD